MTIDWWTLGIQTVNVLILIWLLGRFFWRPVAGMIEQRRAAAQKLLAEAEEKRRQATAALAEIETTKAGFAQEREAILAAAHVTADLARTALLDAAKTEAATLQAAAQAAIEKDKATAAAVWAERANHLAVDIAGRLAARLDGPAVRAAFRDWLLKEIRGLSDQVRQSVAADGVALEAVSATLLEPAEEAQCRTLIAAAFGAKPQITFKADPTLIAGLELHGPHLAVSNSWRADLAQITADLRHDNRA
jgi:F-type H+-transporting ATPase subunit b